MNAVEEIRVVLRYCNAHMSPCWAIHTRPEWQHGGVSVRLINVIGDTAGIEHANGDRHTVPISEISLRFEV